MLFSFTFINMPNYPKENESINLAEYKLIKRISNGNTNAVFLWQHEQDSNLKIVVKKPYNESKDIVRHNLKTINAFYGAGSAWPVLNEIAFAMKYFEGEPFNHNEIEKYIKDINSPISTIERNGFLFTMLDSHQNNYLRLLDGEIIPIDFDYMILHDDTPFLDYQISYLEEKMEMDDAKYIISLYPKAENYLLKHWGSKYIDGSPNDFSVKEENSSIVKLPVQPKKLSANKIEPMKEILQSLKEENSKPSKSHQIDYDKWEQRKNGINRIEQAINHLEQDGLLPIFHTELTLGIQTIKKNAPSPKQKSWLEFFENILKSVFYCFGGFFAEKPKTFAEQLARMEQFSVNAAQEVLARDTLLN